MSLIKELVKQWDNTHSVYGAVKAYLGDSYCSKERFRELMSMLGTEINKRRPAPTKRLFK